MYFFSRPPKKKQLTDSDVSLIRGRDRYSSPTPRCDAMRRAVRRAERRRGNSTRIIESAALTAGSKRVPTCFAAQHLWRHLFLSYGILMEVGFAGFFQNGGPRVR